MKLLFNVQQERDPMHVHQCPICFQQRTCMMGCTTTIFDQREDEPLRGGTIICEHCKNDDQVCWVCNGSGEAMLNRPHFSLTLVNGEVYSYCGACEGKGFTFVGGYVDHPLKGGVYRSANE